MTLRRRRRHKLGGGGRDVEFLRLRLVVKLDDEKNQQYQHHVESRIMLISE